MLMDNFRKQATRFGTRFKQSLIQSVDFSTSPYTLRSSSEEFKAKSIIISTGASPRLLGIPGEKEMFGGKGVTTCATCDGAFYRDMEVVVIGGGDTACEEALFLTRFCSKITLVHRRDELRASKIMADRTIGHEKIEMAWDFVVEKILSDETGNVSGVRMKNVKTSETQQIDCKGVFIAIGHIPNTGPFTKDIPTDENGYFVPENGSQVKTKIPGVYVSGDCADHVYRQAITAAGMGCQAAIEAERYLADTE